MMEGRRLLHILAVFFLVCCLHQGYGDKPSGEVVPVEDSQALKLDQKLYEDNGQTSSEEDEDGDGDNGGRRRRRSVVGHETLLSRPEDSIQMSLVHLDSSDRVKRTSFNLTKFIWTHKIPYVIAFTAEDRRIRLRKVLDHIESQLCVQFFDEGDRFDSSNANWFKENGYETNAYINFHTGSGCWALYGRGGKARGARASSPCYAYISMLHETIHSLGGQHAQKMPHRQKYITVHNNNINTNKRKQYYMAPIKGQINFKFFDSAAIVMYGRNFFSSGGPTYDFVRPEMGQLYGMRSTQSMFYEMNQNYKCVATFCSDSTIDCGPGYLTYIKNKCVCICPDRWDPDTNCKKLIEKVDGPSSFPNTPFSLYSAGQCPDGTEPGTIPLVGKMVPVQTGVPIRQEGKTLMIDVCTRTNAEQSVDWNSWPIGAYCIGKVADVPCELPFFESTFSMKTVVNKPFKNPVGDVIRDGAYVKMKLCCYANGPPSLPMKLPTAVPFRLLRTKEGCQAVDGMFAVETSIQTKTKTSVSGYKPEFKIYRNYFTHYSCLYIPPTYGCNSEFILSASQKSVSFSIPKVGSQRELSKRCFYAFKAPANSRLRLKFKTFKIHPHDKFLVKRFHPWTNPHRILHDSRPTDVTTERNYLFIEFWSYHEEDPIYTGADLEVDLLMDDELCYSADTQGADYGGAKAITETYENCVAWKDATTCPDFPWSNAMTLINSGNKCRNLDTVGMLQPWCYSHVDGTTCVRRYCDVCNEAAPKDMLGGCQDMMKAIPHACSIPFFKNNCFKSCGGSDDQYDSSKVTCPRPIIPAGLSTKGALQDSYTQGSAVTVMCNGHATDIVCNTHGWTHFDNLCTDGCIDESQLCENTVALFPDFCTHSSSQTIARKYCSKSCGVCDTGKCSISDGSTYHLVSPGAGQINTGEVATFACNDGSVLLVGNLKRACSPSGHLLGSEPICDPNSPPVDININRIMPMHLPASHFVNKAVLLVGDQYRIPFTGKITHWYFHCVHDEMISLLVYRETTANTFQQVGVTVAKCVKGRPWTMVLADNQQVSVEKGDVIGVHQSVQALKYSDCNGDQSKVAVREKFKSNDLKTTTPILFPKAMCVYLPIGARVTPL